MSCKNVIFVDKDIAHSYTQTMRNKLVDYFARIMPLTDEEAKAIAASMLIKK